MVKYAKVDNAPGFVRDMETGAVISINTQELQAAKKRKAARRNEKEELKSLRKDVDDIKSMLTQIIEKL